jgi:hypothetical protein
MKPIDLEQNYEGMKLEMIEDHPYYPELRIETEDKLEEPMMNVGAFGTALIKFKITKVEEKNDGSQCVYLDVLQITPKTIEESKEVEEEDKIEYTPGETAKDALESYVNKIKMKE